MGAELLTSPPEGYIEWVKDIKERIRSAQQKAIFAANSAMITLYWQIGREILERQDRQGWGAKVVDRLAADLRREFPEIKGFSISNLKYMRRFAEECPNYQIGQQPVDQLCSSPQRGEVRRGVARETPPPQPSPAGGGS